MNLGRKKISNTLIVDTYHLILYPLAFTSNQQSYTFALRAMGFGLRCDVQFELWSKMEAEDLFVQNQSISKDQSTSTAIIKSEKEAEIDLLRILLPVSNVYYAYYACTLNGKSNSINSDMIKNSYSLAACITHEMAVIPAKGSIQNHR